MIPKIEALSRINITAAMAKFHRILLIVISLPISTLAQKNGNVLVGSSLIAADDKSPPWLSPAGDFAFGFQHLQNTDFYLLSIWYDKIPEKTVVWYASSSNPTPRGSKVQLTADHGLVLYDPRGNELWNSESIADDVAYGFLNDTGNFALMRQDSFKLWESFSSPTDTMLPSQIMERGGVLVSRLSETNFSQGRFQFRLLDDGNLVLNSRDLVSNHAYDAYYISGTYDPSNDSNSGYQVVFNEEGYMYVLKRNNQRLDLTTNMLMPTSDYYHRATLNFDGVFTQYYYPRRSTSSQGWTALWSKPDNICVNISGTSDSGACGYNNVCTLDDYKRPTCECPQGYSLLNPDDKYGSCKPNFLLSCGENGTAASAEYLYDFVELIDTAWPTSEYAVLERFTEEDCKKSCLNDCFCAVAILRDNICRKKKLPLSNGRKDRSVNGKAFLKFSKREPPPQIGQSGGSKPKKNQDTLILVGSVLLGSSVFVNFVFIVAACLGFFLIYRKKTVKISQSNNALATNLSTFAFEELARATNGFKEKLGRGAFASVYKGVLQMGSKKVVAVKMLNRLAQDSEKEFKAEVNAIGQTHHKNLVRLLGFCDEGEHRLLVYEYMSNGTLAGFLFGDLRPSWKQRTDIAMGIARGLLYLHEECSTQIIHCDIKPQNILLDEYYNARISDFGLAKLLMLNQSRTNTGLRGTRGYVAPEWFRNSPITVKVDVYSFGILLLELICCRRSLGDLENTGGEVEILPDYVWQCYQEKNLEALVQNDSQALSDSNKLMRFVMIGLWCIQEDPSLRPTIRKVSQMLEGVVKVPSPPCPYLFTSTTDI